MLRLEGFRPPLAPDPFESLVTSITAQQVSLFAAFAIRNRMIERWASVASTRSPSTAADRAAAGSEYGWLRRKAEYVLALARTELDLDQLGLLGTTRYAPV